MLLTTMAEGEVGHYNPMSLPSGSAVLLSVFYGVGGDDSVLSEGALAYLFAKVDDEWRILTIMANLARKLVACE